MLAARGAHIIIACCLVEQGITTVKVRLSHDDKQALHISPTEGRLQATNSQVPSACRCWKILDRCPAAERAKRNSCYWIWQILPPYIVLCTASGLRTCPWTFSSAMLGSWLLPTGVLQRMAWNSNSRSDPLIAHAAASEAQSQKPSAS